jgi:hypothetical protein
MAIDVAVTTAPEVVLVGATKTGVDVLEIVSKTVLLIVVKTKLMTMLGSEALIVSETEAVVYPVDVDVALVVIVTVGSPVFFDVVAAVVISGSPKPKEAARLLRVTGPPVLQIGETSEKVERVS